MNESDPTKGESCLGVNIMEFHTIRLDPTVTDLLPLWFVSHAPSFSQKVTRQPSASSLAVLSFATRFARPPRGPSSFA